MRTIPPSSMRSKGSGKLTYLKKNGHIPKGSTRLIITYGFFSLSEHCCLIILYRRVSGRQAGASAWQRTSTTAIRFIRRSVVNSGGIQDCVRDFSVVPLCVVAVDIGEKRRVGESLRFETRHCQMCGVSDPGGAEMREAPLSFLGKALCDRGGRHTE